MNRKPAYLRRLFFHSFSRLRESVLNNVDSNAVYRLPLVPSLWRCLSQNGEPRDVSK